MHCKYITVIYLADCHRASVAANNGKQSHRSNDNDDKVDCRDGGCEMDKSGLGKPTGMR